MSHLHTLQVTRRRENRRDQNIVIKMLFRHQRISLSNQCYRRYRVWINWTKELISSTCHMMCVCVCGIEFLYQMLYYVCSQWLLSITYNKFAVYIAAWA